MTSGRVGWIPARAAIRALMKRSLNRERPAPAGLSKVGLAFKPARLVLEVAPVAREPPSLGPHLELCGRLRHAVELRERAALPRDPTPGDPVRPRAGALQPPVRRVQVSPRVASAGAQLHGALVDDRIPLRVAVVEAEARRRSGAFLFVGASLCERR